MLDKKVALLWEELAEQYKDYNDILIAKLDGTANDAPGVKLGGFPHIVFYPKNLKKKGILYKGERDIDDLNAFIR